MAINNVLNTATTPIAVGAGGTGSSAVPTDGQLLIGSTGGGAFVAASLTAGAGISLTPGAGTLSIASTIVDEIVWAGISGNSQAAAVNTGYVVQNAAVTTVTLPTTAPLGSIVIIQGLGAAGWVMQAAAGQTIKIGQSSTSTAGTVTSAANFDALEVVCIVADTTWAMRSSVSSGLVTA